jgi:hypothetical protein
MIFVALVRVGARRSPVSDRERRRAREGRASAMVALQNG